jgi:hypothetical protein
MIKKTLLSLAAGVLLTVLLSAAPVVEAACQGYCADRHLSGGCELGYAGCTIEYDEHDNPTDVTCYYSGACEMQ